MGPWILSIRPLNCTEGPQYRILEFAVAIATLEKHMEHGRILEHWELQDWAEKIISLTYSQALVVISYGEGNTRR